MDQPAIKRQKLSPTTPTTSSAMINGGKSTTRNNVPSSGHRASFMSPTKTSLSRFNSNLLTQKSSERRRSRRREDNGSRIQTSNVNSGGNILDRPTVRTDTESPTARDNGEPDEGKRAPVPQNRLSASPRRRSRTPTVQNTPSKVPPAKPAPILQPLPTKSTNSASRPGSGKTRQSRSAATQRDRPLNGINIDESTMEKLPHTPTHRGNLPGADKSNDLGPSLPSTPSQLGLEAPYERPKGLLFTKTDKRTKKGHERPSSSQDKEAVAQHSPTERPVTFDLGPKIFLPGLPKPAPTLLQADLQKKLASRTHFEKEALRLGSNYLEDVLFSSWQHPDGKETVGQQRQRKKLTELTNKLFRLREEVDRLQSSTGENEEIFRNQAEQLDASSERTTSNPLELSQMLSKFFPFCPGHSATPVDATPNSVRLDCGETVQIRNSQLLNNHANDTETLFQRHDAEFLSNGSVLVALQITIESNTMKISNLELLEQSSFSPQELRTWSADNADAKELTSIGTAINRCRYVVECRAACWRSCIERHPNLVVINNPSPKHSISLHDQQQTLTFQRHLLSFSITWTITLRKEGDAETRLSIAVDLPPAWSDAGIVSGSEGQNVREAFDLLVRERGVTEAIGVIVKLLFPPPVA